MFNAIVVNNLKITPSDDLHTARICVVPSFAVQICVTLIYALLIYAMLFYGTQIFTVTN